MATSFNLQEYILFRTEIKRELTNNEVDTNFKMVANPWEDTRIYEIGNIVYHPVIVDDPSTTGLDQVLAWWRPNVRTTQGVFDTFQWDMIGGIGSGNINIQGANSFGKIKVNSTAPTGALQAGFEIQTGLRGSATYYAYGSTCSVASCGVGTLIDSYNIIDASLTKMVSDKLDIYMVVENITDEIDVVAR